MPTRQEALLNKIKSYKLGTHAEDDNSDEQDKVGKAFIRRGKIKKTLDDVLLKNTLETLSRVKHDLIPGLNIGSQPVESLSELQDFPNCIVSIPYPVYVASKHPERVDICHRRTLSHQLYTKRLSIARTCYLNAVKKSRKLRAEEKNGIYHASIFDFAERLECNPDPYFNGSYDFYYTGGNLCVLSEPNYVVHVGGDELQDVNISRFSNKKDLTTVQMRQMLCKTVPQNSEIMQVIPVRTQYEARPNCFVTRQRNCVTLYAYHGEDSLKALTQYNNASTPFIGFAQSVGDVNKIILTNMKQHVRLFDLNSVKPASCKLYVVAEGANRVQWNTVKPWREHTYLYANRKELFLMDTRTACAEWRSTRCSFGPSEFFCDEIASLALSEFKKQIYVGTNHKLYNLDTRCWSQTFDGSSTVCRWLHQLEYPPLLLETFRQNSNEYVALSSQIAGDMRICELTRTGRVVENPSKKRKLNNSSSGSKHEYKALSLPYQSTTLQEAYEHARLHGKCLRPHADLKQRLLCCTTGLAFYENTKNKYRQTLILSSNSIGDVFAHQLSDRGSQEHEPRTSAMTDEVMCRYEDQICKITKPPLNYMEVLPIKALRKIFLCAVFDSKCNDQNFLAAEAEADLDLNNIRDTKPTLKRRNFGRWRKSIQELHSFKDALVQDLLSIWDIDYEQQIQVKLSDLKDDMKIKPDPESMINDWLRKHDKEQPMSSIPIHHTKFNNTVALETSYNALQVNASILEETQSSYEQMNDLPQSTQIYDESTTQLDASVNMKITAGLNSTTINVQETSDRQENMLESTINLGKKFEYSQKKSLNETNYSACEKATPRKKIIPKKKLKYVKGF